MLTLVTMLTLPLCIVLKHNRKPTPSNSFKKLFSCFNSSSKSFNLNHNLSLRCNSLTQDNKLSLKIFNKLDDELDTQPQTADERLKSINLNSKFRFKTGNH